MRRMRPWIFLIPLMLAIVGAAAGLWIMRYPQSPLGQVGKKVASLFSVHGSAPAPVPCSVSSGASGARGAKDKSCDQRLSSDAKASTEKVTGRSVAGDTKAAVAADTKIGAKKEAIREIPLAKDETTLAGTPLENEKYPAIVSDGKPVFRDPASPAQVGPRSAASPSPSAEQKSSAAVQIPITNKSCAPQEFAGPGPELSKVSAEQWNTFMKEFHGAKKNLSDWLEKNQSRFSARAIERMQVQIKELRIRRPLSYDEPDLSWRGLVVWSWDQQGEPLLKVGGGFFQLLSTNPSRARFELTRAIAQAWAPCEMDRVHPGGRVWEPFLKCMGLSHARSCFQGTLSEAGWAVSTVLANKIAAPRCEIPALMETSTTACVDQLLSGKDFAAGDAPAADQVQRVPAGLQSSQSKPEIKPDKRPEVAPNSDSEPKVPTPAEVVTPSALRKLRGARIEGQLEASRAVSSSIRGER